MNSNSVLARGVSLLALLCMLTSGVPAFARGAGGVHAAAPAGHAAGGFRGAAPQARSMPQMRSFPQARTGGQFQNSQRGTFQGNPGLRANPGFRGTSPAQRGTFPTQRGTFPGSDRSVPGRTPVFGSPAGGQGGRELPGSTLQRGVNHGAIIGPDGHVFSPGISQARPGIGTTRLPEGGQFGAGRGHIGSSVAYSSLARDGRYQGRGFVDPQHHIGSINGRPSFEPGNRTQFAANQFNRLGNGFYGRNSGGRRLVSEGRWPWHPSPFLGLGVGIGFYNSWGYDGLFWDYDTGYFALDDYCATPFMFYVGSGRFYQADSGYVQGLPFGYGAPITVVVTEIVPNYDDQGNIIGYEPHTFYYDAFADASGQYGYYDYLGEFHALQW